MNEEAIVVLVVLPLLLMFLAAPIIAMVMTFRLRSEQKRQAEVLNLLLERSHAARVTESAPAIQPARSPAAPALAPMPALAAAPEVTPPPPPAAIPATEAAPLLPPPLPPPPPPPPAAREPGPLESKARALLGRIWNWVIIGEEFRSPGTSWEFALATNWLLRLGIVAVVIGIGFFLKFSIERGLLGPQARVALSVLTGLGMLVGGVRLVGRPYQLLGQGLIGGGLAVLYFSLFAACNFYHLVGLLTAFGLMALVTLTAGVLAVRLNSLLVAVLGILGGYGTPVMLSTGAKNFPGLFGYMLLLGIGVLGISRRRHWPLLNYLGLVLTYGLATAAIGRQYEPSDLAVVLPFLVGFFMLYAAAMFLYNIAHREKATVLELLGIMANALTFFGLAYHTVTRGHPEKAAALLALALGVFFVALVWLFLARRHLDRGLLFTFLALAALFAALTPPLAISKQWITVCWALQGVVMLWLAIKIDSRFLRLLACAACLLAACRLAFYDLDREFAAALPAGTTAMQYLRIFAARFVALGAPIAALGAAWKLLRRAPAPSEPGLAVGVGNDLAATAWTTTAALVMAVVAVGLIFIYGQLELYRTCRFFSPELALPAVTLAWFGLGLFLLSVARDGARVWPWVLLCAAGAGMVLKLLFVDMAQWRPWSGTYGAGYTGGLVFIRFADFGLCIALLTIVFTQTRGGAGDPRIRRTAGITALVLLFLYLTLEANTALTRFVPGLRAGGITLLWAAYALTLLLFGLNRGVRGLRYASLAIFTVVVGKIFLVDLSDLDALYRIVAFIVLGVILLGAALVYLKNRRRFQPPQGGPS